MYEVIEYNIRNFEATKLIKVFIITGQQSYDWFDANFHSVFLSANLFTPTYFFSFTSFSTCAIYFIRGLPFPFFEEIKIQTIDEGQVDGKNGKGILGTKYM